MTTVYRIENIRDGKGIYTSGFQPYNGGEITTGYCYPTPRSDEGIGEYFTENHKCAFNSIEIMRQIIRIENFAPYYESGFRIFRLVLDEFAASMIQTVFTEENVKEKVDISQKFGKEFVNR